MGFQHLRSSSNILTTASTDHSVEPIYEDREMPQFGEVPTTTRSTFEQVFKTLADKYHSQNIMLITHGIGVGVVSTVLKNTRVVHVDYCAILRRPIFLNHDSFVAGNFELCLLDETAGIKFSNLVHS